MADQDSMYRLVDGTAADPKDCSKGADGVLRHKGGMAVAMRSTGEPQTLGEDAVLHGNVAAAAAGVAAAENETTVTVPVESAGRPAAANVPADPPKARPVEPKAD